MSLTHTEYVRGGKRIPAPQSAGEVVAVRYEIPVTAAIAGAVGDIIEVGALPAYTRIVDAILDSTDLDTNSSPTIALDVGLMSGNVGEALDEDGNARTCGAELFSASNVGKAGTVARASLVTAFTIAPVASDRSIGLKIKTKAATGQAGVVGLTVFYGT